MLVNKLLLLTLIASSRYVFGVNVLYLSGVASPSHHIWNRALALGLVGRGHNVTLVGPDENKIPATNNFSYIQTENVYEAVTKKFDYNAMIDYNSFELLQMFQDWSLFQCTKYYNSTGLKRLWNFPKDFKFDVIVVDTTAGPCLLSMIERFKFPPTVGVTPFILPPYVSYSFGNHLHPSFIPWYNLPYTHEMSFTQRVWNWLFTMFDIYLRRTYENDQYDVMARETFGSEFLKADWRQLEKHITIILSNTDPILDVPQPMPPNIIPVGGLHTRTPNKLPKDYQDLLDNAKDGVIVFSLGTNFRSDRLSAAKQRALLKAFSKLKELVIWKFESDIKDLPKNVIVRKFLPQNDILGHPNVKLFIGHGGALSTQEAIYHGVPMIVAPFVFDQKLNAKAVEKRKFGVELDIESITTEYVSSKLNEALGNPLYTSTMKAAAQRYRDQPSTALERGIFWVEYAAKHDGADFMNSPARNMSWTESSNADVFAFLALVALGIVLLLILLVRKLKAFFSALFRRKDKVKTE